eukprot:14245797-Alexandrium_andersonii.AAC.2
MSWLCYRAEWSSPGFGIRKELETPSSGAPPWGPRAKRGASAIARGVRREHGQGAAFDLPEHDGSQCRPRCPPSRG